VVYGDGRKTGQNLYRRNGVAFPNGEEDFKGGCDLKRLSHRDFILHSASLD
jgi:hypothetical protein